MKKVLARRRLSFAVHLALAAGAMLGAAHLLADPSQAESSAVIPLSTLNGANGFRMDGAQLSGEESGWAVAKAGDVNGDGIADLVIGTNSTAFGAVGRAYVVFGHSGGFTSALNLSGLNGSNGFRIDGVAANDHAGGSVGGAGDVNGDGFDDVIIGADFTDSLAGRAYVVFGHSGAFAPVLGASSLDGSNGFRLDSAAALERTGIAVAMIGDVNGDGVDDLVVGASSAQPGGNSNAGSAFVVFGHTGAFASSLNLSTLSGSNGFRLDAVNVNDHLGQSVGRAGDVNGDGFDDLVVGAPYAQVGGAAKAGSTYVVFGHSGPFTSPLLASAVIGSTGVRLEGSIASGYSGISVAGAGDVNGDGFDDVVIGQPVTSGYSGRSYVVFGHSGAFVSPISLSALNGADGFRLDGPTGSFSGMGVATAGDVNGDGIADVMVGAPGADAGSTFVFFGHSGVFPSNLSLTALNGTNGFRMDGEALGDNSGRGVAGVGDINADGSDDLLVGAPYTNPPAREMAGSSYVVFGVRPDNIFANGFEGP